MMFGIVNPKERENTFIFEGTATVRSDSFTALDNDFYVWQKPPGIRFVHIIAIGAGSKGGFGHGGSSPNGIWAGGGGGGSGGISSLLIPSIFLPDTLYIRPMGFDWQSGNGFNDLTTVSPYCSNNYPILVAGGGAIGASATAGNPWRGAGGAGASAASVTPGSGTRPMIHTVLGSYNFYAGQAGANGATNIAGENLTLLSTSILSGGAGGAGHPGTSTASNAAGGELVIKTDPATGLPNSLNLPTVSGGLAGGGRGSGGHRSYAPLTFTGGSGGGSSYSTSLAQVPSGSGGDGAPGCGGGGGGGAASNDGTSGFAQSARGRGGPGLVIITCF